MSQIYDIGLIFLFHLKKRVTFSNDTVPSITYSRIGRRNFINVDVKLRYPCSKNI